MILTRAEEARDKWVAKLKSLLYDERPYNPINIGAKLSGLVTRMMITKFRGQV